MSYCKELGKDQVIFLTEEDAAKPSTVELSEPSPSEVPQGLITESGEINWSCPCLGGMAVGPCGVEFRDAFSCFHYSEAEPKGSDCFEKFVTMQECMKNYPELYDKSTRDDEDEEDFLNQAQTGELNLEENSEKEPKKLEESPVTEAEKLEESPVTEAEKLEESPVTEAEKLEESPVTEAEKLEESPVAEAEKLEESPVTEAEKLEESPKMEVENLEESLETATENEAEKPEEISEIVAEKVEESPKIEVEKMEEGISEREASEPEEILEKEVEKTEEVENIEERKQEETIEVLENSDAGDNNSDPPGMTAEKMDILDLPSEDKKEAESTD